MMDMDSAADVRSDSGTALNTLCIVLGPVVDRGLQSLSSGNAVTVVDRRERQVPRRSLQSRPDHEIEAEQRCAGVVGHLDPSALDAATLSSVIGDQGANEMDGFLPSLCGI